MKTLCQRRSATVAISLHEVLIAVAVMGVVAAVAVPRFVGTVSGSQLTKLESDVATINQAIKVYTASGGSMVGVTDPQAVLDKMKTSRTIAGELQFSGLGGSMIDKRLKARMQTAAQCQRSLKVYHRWSNQSVPPRGQPTAMIWA